MKEFRVTENITLEELQRLSNTHLWKANTVIIVTDKEQDKQSKTWLEYILENPSKLCFEFRYLTDNFFTPDPQYIDAQLTSAIQYCWGIPVTVNGLIDPDIDPGIPKRLLMSAERKNHLTKVWYGGEIKLDTPRTWMTVLKKKDIDASDFIRSLMWYMSCPTLEEGKTVLQIALESLDVNEKCADYIKIMLDNVDYIKFMLNKEFFTRKEVFENLKKLLDQNSTLTFLPVITQQKIRILSQYAYFTPEQQQELIKILLDTETSFLIEILENVIDNDFSYKIGNDFIDKYKSLILILLSNNSMSALCLDYLKNLKPRGLSDAVIKYAQQIQDKEEKCRFLNNAKNENTLLGKIVRTGRWGRTSENAGLLGRINRELQKLKPQKIGENSNNIWREPASQPPNGFVGPQTWQFEK